MLQIIIIIVTLAADQLSKYLLTPVLTQLPGNTMPIIKDVFDLTYIENRGASFGMLQNAQSFFIIMTSIVLIAATYYMIKNRKRQTVFLKISLSMIIGGALGNYIDRILFGYVRDLFDFSGFGFPWIFNVADACLVVGAILLGIYILFIYKEEDGKSIFAKREKEQKNTDEENIGE